MRIKVTRTLFGLIATLLMLFLTGCATSFQDNKLLPINQFPKVESAEPMYVNLGFTGRLNGKEWTDHDNVNRNYLLNLCIERLEASDMFSSISNKDKKSDLQLYVAVINYKEADEMLHLLSSWSLFLVPYKTTDQFELLAIIKRLSTNEKYQIKLTDGVTHRQHLLLTPLSLFNSPHHELNECHTRLFDNLCMEIHQLMLQKPAPDTETNDTFEF